MVNGGGEDGVEVAPAADASAAGAGGDGQVWVYEGRVIAVMQALMDEGEIEEVRGEGEGEGSEVRYRRVPPVPELGADGRRHLATRRAAGARRGRAAMARLAGEVVDFGVTKPEFGERQLQSDLEKLFAEFFDGVVSEWNPCFTEDGRWRYKWDDEIGAHNVVYTEE